MRACRRHSGGTKWMTSSQLTLRSPRCRRDLRQSATAMPTSTITHARSRRCSNCQHGMRRRAWATRRGRRNTRRRPESRHVCSRRGVASQYPRLQSSRVPRFQGSRIRRSGSPIARRGSIRPTGRRTSKHPLLEIGRGQKRDEVLAGLERWKARYPDAASHLEPSDVLVDAMRGRFTTWTRIRVNLQHVPEALRPSQEAPDPDDVPQGYEESYKFKVQSSNVRAQGSRSRTRRKTNDG